MKRRMSTILGIVMAVLCVMSISVPALAVDTPEVSIPVTVSLSGTLPNPAEDFTIVLKADDASFPMPEGSDENGYTMTVTGADTKNLPAITYNRVGIYTYTVLQTAGTNKKCTYDTTVYSLIVYITNAEDGSGLEATAVLYPNGEGEKMTGAEFKNVYETVKPRDPNSPSTGDTSTPVLYAAMIAGSLAVIVVLFLTGKHRKTEE